MPGREGWTEAELFGLILPLHTRQERRKRSLELVGQRDPGLAENAGNGGSLKILVLQLLENSSLRQ